MKLTAHLQLVPRVRRSGNRSLRPLYTIMAWTGTNVPLLSHFNIDVFSPLTFPSALCSQGSAVAVCWFKSLLITKGRKQTQCVKKARKENSLLFSFFIHNLLFYASVLRDSKPELNMLLYILFHLLSTQPLGAANRFENGYFFFQMEAILLILRTCIETRYRNNPAYLQSF